MSKAFQLIAQILVLVGHLALVNGQISTPCTLSMVTSFTPCLNFITGSSNNGISPTTSCCGSLKSIMETGMNCACLLITANVPIQLPINRTLALSLPGACNMSGVPLQCKPSGSPLPAPGPVILLAPSLPPSIASSPFSPRASKVSASTSQSEAIEQLEPAAAPRAESEGPTRGSAIRPVLGPPISTSMSTKEYYTLPSLVQLILLYTLALTIIPNSLISL